MKVKSPMCATLRRPTIASSMIIPRQSFPAAERRACPTASGAKRARCGRAKSSADATMSPGTTMKTPPSSPSPSVITRNDANSGPMAKPTLPPTEKSDMPLARRSPLTKLANFEPSGW